MLKNFTPRLYQETILATTTRKNTLVVLPTGLGKTALAFMLAAQRLKQYPQSKIMMLAPTRPLAEQHMKTFQEHLNIPEEKCALFTGSISPKKRHQLWQSTQLIIGTPQGIENDLLGDKIELTSVSLIIFDEAHHATGDYAYTFIAKRYMKHAQFPRILGLTASPGSTVEKIREICTNIFVEAVEVRTLHDPDVQSYVKEIETEWIKVTLPETFRRVQKFLHDCYTSKLHQVKQHGYLTNLQLRKRELLQLQGALHGEIAQGNHETGLLKSISLCAEALKVQHALELLETQGIPPLMNYFAKIQLEARNRKSKAAQHLAADINLKSAMIITRKIADSNIRHPKMIKLVDTIEQELQNTEKMLVFTQYRDSATEIVAALNNLSHIHAALFVGQTKKRKTGMTQKEQKEMLEKFRNDEFNILVCTSVGEEGLDIPAVDIVVFYEPIPSAIRHIQRRGRTGRHAIGRVLIFMTEHTRDEAYRWVAHHKEQRMMRTLEQLKKEFSLTKQKPLSSFISEQKIQIVTDYREKGSDVMKQLVELGISLRLEKLTSADYVCSSSCGVEFKTAHDFVQSIIDGRFITQLKELKKTFSKPLVIIQGEQDIYALRKIHPNAIRGMLATITISFGIPLIQTKNAKETAALLAMIARREQDSSRDFSMHTKKPLSIREQQEYIISALPSVGLKMAQQLLLHFGSVEKLATSSIDELKKVDGIGDILAERIQNVLKQSYEKE